MIIRIAIALLLLTVSASAQLGTLPYSGAAIETPPSCDVLDFSLACNSQYFSLFKGMI